MALFLFFFFVQQFKAGHLSLAYEIPMRHKRKLQHPTKTHCVWGGDGGKKCNIQFICLFLIDYGEIIHVLRLLGKNLVPYRSLDFYTEALEY